MRISDLAAGAAVTAKALRYYEHIGVLPEPTRSPSGYRDYDPAAIDRIRFIRASAAVGLSLGEIRQVVALRDRGEVPCHHVYKLLQRRAADVEERIEELHRLGSDLKALTRRARRLDPAACDPRGVCHLITPSILARSGVNGNISRPRQRGGGRGRSSRRRKQ